MQLSNQDSKSSFEFKSIAKSNSPSCCNDNAFPEPSSVLDLHPPPDATYSSLSERISASSEGDPSAAPEEASGSQFTPSFDSFLLQRPFEVFALQDVLLLNVHSSTPSFTSVPSSYPSDSCSSSHANNKSLALHSFPSSCFKHTRNIELQFSLACPCQQRLSPLFSAQALVNAILIATGTFQAHLLPKSVRQRIQLALPTLLPLTCCQTQELEESAKFAFICPFSILEGASLGVYVLNWFSFNDRNRVGGVSSS